MDRHQRLGHQGFDNVKQLAKTDTGITVEGSLTNPISEPCQLGKQTRKPNHSPATHRTSSLLVLIHSELAGPMTTTSLEGAKYFLIFINDYSRYTTIYTIKNQSAVMECFQKFKAVIQNQYKHRIKRFRSDGGGEYTSAAFSRLLTEAGIVREQTAPYSLEQNGVCEPANRTIIGRAKAMMFAAGLPDEMWGEAVHPAVYLKNWSPMSVLEKSMTHQQKNRFLRTDRARFRTNSVRSLRPVLPDFPCLLAFHFLRLVHPDAPLSLHSV